jgi:hypothetical protein
MLTSSNNQSKYAIVMNTYNILSFSFLLSFSPSSFGAKATSKNTPPKVVAIPIKVGSENILVKNRQDMSKIYRAIRPIIAKKDYESVAKIIAQAYIDYAKIPANLAKDRSDGISWPYLGRAAKYYYNGANQEQQFQSLRTVALKTLQQTQQSLNSINSKLKKSEL